MTTVYLRDFEIKGPEVVGQYASEEQFGMLFEKGSPLVDCVNQVLGEMESDGTLQDLQERMAPGLPGRARVRLSQAAR